MPKRLSTFTSPASTSPASTSPVFTSPAYTSPALDCPRFTLSAVVLSAVVLLLMAVPTLAETVVSDGPDFQVNTFTTGNQGFAAIAAGPDGSLVAVWESSGQDGSSFGIFGQRFDAARAPVGAEFPVNTFTEGNQYDPAVAFGPDGSFVVVWQSADQDGSAYGIFGQRYDAAGVALGDEFAVNSFTTADQEYPDIAIDSSGQFLVVWESDGQDQSFGGIYGQLYGSDGQPIDTEFRLNTTTLDEQNDPAVAATSDGFLVVWESDRIDGSGEAVVLQRLDANADFVGGEQQVNSSTAGDQEDPDIAVTSSGAFAVVWESDGQDGSGESVVAQVYDADGLEVGSELLLDTKTLDDQDDPAIAAIDDTSFVAVWESAALPTGDDIAGRRFNVAGELEGEEFAVNTEPESDQDVVSIAGGSGRFVALWRSFGTIDGTLAGVAGRAFEVAEFADGFESGDTSAWSASSP